MPERPGGDSLAFQTAQEAHVELTRTVPAPAAAFLAARRMYLNGERVDMLALASELGVSRATIYRWTGDRERLLADVLWSLSDEAFEQAKADHAEYSGGAVVRVTEGFIYSDAIVAGDAIVRIKPEVERAARIVGLLLG